MTYALVIDGTIQSTQAARRLDMGRDLLSTDGT